MLRSTNKYASKSSKHRKPLKPTVCIIICAYNAECYLPECLNSVANQKMLPNEVIIVDDGSTDCTGDIADSFALSHQFCSVVHGKNEGLLLARRKGLAQCHSNYVMFLDSDDILKSDAVMIVVEQAILNEADIVVFRLTENRDFTPPRFKQKPKAATYEGKELSKRLVLAGNINSMCGKLYKHSLFDIDADYSRFACLMHGEDLLQSLPVFGAAEKVEVIDECLYYYRPSETSSTSSYKPSQREDIFTVLNEVERYANEWRLDFATSACWARNITYLLSILFNDPEIDDEEKQEELDVISSHAAFFCGDNGSMSSLRADYRLLLKCLIDKRYRVLNILIGLRGRLLG